MSGPWCKKIVLNYLLKHGIDEPRDLARCISEDYDEKDIEMISEEEIKEYEKTVMPRLIKILQEYINDSANELRYRLQDIDD